MQAVQFGVTRRPGSLAKTVENGPAVERETVTFERTFAWAVGRRTGGNARLEKSPLQSWVMMVIWHTRNSDGNTRVI